jgi:hypothetical protein
VGCGLVPSLVLVIGGVRPGTSLAVSAGPKLGAKAAIAVGCGMRTQLPDVQTGRPTRARVLIKLMEAPAVVDLSPHTPTAPLTARSPPTRVPGQIRYQGSPPSFRGIVAMTSESARRVHPSQ